VATSSVCVCTNLRMATRVVTRLYDDALAPCGIGVNQFAILRWLRFSPLAISELAAKLKMDRTTLARDVQVLERQGLLTIEPDPADRRRRVLTVTEAGFAVLADATPRWKELQAQVTEAVGATALADLIAGLAHLTDRALAL
jgi:DNA-binding MarR family transcriptional regulator